MNLLESTRVALRGLASNKMRTGLTMLGIIIGVGVVILVVAIGQGAAKSVTDAVNSLGTNVLTIWPGASRVRMTAAITGVSATIATQQAAAAATSTTATTTGSVSSSTSAFSSNRLTFEDSKLIASRFKKSVDAVAPIVRGNVQIKLENKDSSTNLTGS